MKLDIFNENNSATYCPEDNKLRLYVGRVPHDEYLALRKEGWQATPKQDCDFAAVWTVDREDTALSYAGTIGDEDQSPVDRAADRAERFAGYRERRLGEATSFADRCQSLPSAYGYQDKAKAVRAADRHDCIAFKAVNAWDKAEYWQERTSGVIANALHVSSPSVRMGRIKTIEADLRKLDASHQKWVNEYKLAVKFSQNPQDTVDSYALERDTSKQEAACFLIGLLSVWAEFTHPRDPNRKGRLYSLMNPILEDPLSLEEALILFFAKYSESLTYKRRNASHLANRLAYEWQMLEAQGGRAAVLEMVEGGFFGGHQIHKINKSPKTGRVVSVDVMIPTNGQNRWGREYEEGKDPIFRLERIKTERKSESAYREPTKEEAETYQAEKKAKKDSTPKTKLPPLINPTRAEAGKIQELFNAANAKRWEKENGQPRGNFKPETGEVLEMTQAQYKEASSGSYARAKTRELCSGGRLTQENLYSRFEKVNQGEVFCKVRVTGYQPRIVIFLTDKPSKALPSGVWKVEETQEKANA